MAMVSKTAVGIAVGLAGFIVGYCYYFDQKRRSDPDFKKKLRERRRAKKEAQEAQGKMPSFKDPEAMQKYFLQEVELGEELLASGDVEKGIEHLANAVIICGKPQQLLSVLQNTLPTSAFNQLVYRLTTTNQKFFSQTPMAEEDVE